MNDGEEIRAWVRDEVSAICENVGIKIPEIEFGSHRAMGFESSVSMLPITEPSLIGAKISGFVLRVDPEWVRNRPREVVRYALCLALLSSVTTGRVVSPSSHWVHFVAALLIAVGCLFAESRFGRAAMYWLLAFGIVLFGVVIFVVMMRSLSAMSKRALEISGDVWAAKEFTREMNGRNPKWLQFEGGLSRRLAKLDRLGAELGLPPDRGLSLQAAELPGPGAPLDEERD